MKFITRPIYKLRLNRDMPNVRSKFIKAAVLKTVNKPLINENLKISDKLNEGQVNTIHFLLLVFL